jgi:hypothetical protein
MSGGLVDVHDFLDTFYLPDELRTPEDIFVLGGLIASTFMGHPGAPRMRPIKPVIPMSFLPFLRPTL